MLLSAVTSSLRLESLPQSMTAVACTIVHQECFCCTNSSLLCIYCPRKASASDVDSARYKDPGSREESRNQSRSCGARGPHFRIRPLVLFHQTLPLSLHRFSVLRFISSLSRSRESVHQQRINPASEHYLPFGRSGDI